MAKLFSRITWLDEVLAGVLRYNIKDNAGAPITTNVQIDLATGITVAGTPIDATRLNRMEAGIDVIDTRASGLALGYISENSFKLAWVSAASITIAAGSLDINGVLCTAAAPITLAGLTLGVNAIHYVYAYATGAAVTIEQNTTVPVWDGALNYYKKNGDASKRCIGFIVGNATGAIRRFQNSVSGRVSEVIYTDGDPTGRVPVSAGTATAAWTAFTLAPLVPVHATHSSVILKMVGVTLGDDGIVAISPIDLGAAALSNMAPNYIRQRASAASAHAFTGASWNAIDVPSTQYYRLQIMAGTPMAYVELVGARFSR